MNQGPFREDQVGLLAERMQEVHEQSAAQVDLMGQLMEQVRRATAEEFPAGRIVAADDGVRDWVEAYVHDLIEEQNEEARAAGRPRLSGSVEEITSHVLADVLGLGKLESLREMEGVEDIAINGPREVYC